MPCACRCDQKSLHTNNLIFSDQNWIVKPLKLLEVVLAKLWEYIPLQTKRLQLNQVILFGRFNLEIVSYSILAEQKDGELVQNPVYTGSFYCKSKDILILFTISSMVAAVFMPMDTNMP